MGGLLRPLQCTPSPCYSFTAELLLLLAAKNVQASIKDQGQDYPTTPPCYSTCACMHPCAGVRTRTPSSLLLQEAVLDGPSLLPLPSTMQRKRASRASTLTGSTPTGSSRVRSVVWWGALAPQSFPYILLVE
jgi:hypothetical protein